MSDFVKILNLLLDRVSIGSFIFELPEKTYLFSGSIYSPIILNQVSNDLRLYNNLDTIIEKPKDAKVEEVINFNSRNKKLHFIAPPPKDNESVCLSTTNKTINIFNSIKFIEYYSEDLTKIMAEDNLIYVGIKDKKLQTSYTTNLDFYLLVTEDGILTVTDSMKHESLFYIFNTTSAFKNYHATSNETFKWIEIIFYFENQLRTLFQNVKIMSGYIYNEKHHIEIEYVMNGEKIYKPLEGYTESSFSDSLEDEEVNNFDYKLIMKIEDLPIINIINYDKVLSCKHIFHESVLIHKNISRYCTIHNARLNHKFKHDNYSFKDNNYFPYLIES